MLTACTNLMINMQVLEARHAAALAALKEGWAAELRRQREAWGAAERAKREAWAEAKAAEIKALTVKVRVGGMQRAGCVLVVDGLTASCCRTASSVSTLIITLPVTLVRALRSRCSG